MTLSISDWRIDPKAKSLASLNGLTVRLARSRDEIKAALRLRYRVFYEELGAQPAATSNPGSEPVDCDAFDPHCDHLLVLDGDEVIGTYRLLLSSRVGSAPGYYSQTEFDLSNFLEKQKNRICMELGRSCILKDYRTKRTMELLWAGTWAYALQNQVEVMFGCLSFHGVDPKACEDVFAWLNDNHRMEEAEDCRPGKMEGFDLGSMAKSDVPAGRHVFKKLPPLLKGYLRLGAKVGSWAAIDRQFGTIDLLVVLKVDQINPRYIAHYGEDASRFSNGEAA